MERGINSFMSVVTGVYRSFMSFNRKKGCTVHLPADGQQSHSSVVDRLL